MTAAEVCRRHRVQPRGIVHVGAHHGEEREAYRRLGVARVLWVEADPEHMAALRGNLAGYAGMTAVQACLADTEGWADFHRTDNRGESSSLLPLGSHAELFPHIRAARQTRLATTTFTTLAAREGLALDEYDFLVLDVQGAELLALRGFGELLWRFTGVFAEVNLEHLYRGCALLGEVDANLAGFDLVRRETLLTPRRYGDALYLRCTAHPEPPADLAARAERVRGELVLQRVFTFRRGGEPTRAVELLDGGRVGQGATPEEAAWLVRAAGHDVVLEFVGAGGRTSCLVRGDDGVWRGESLFHPDLTVELAPPGGVGSWRLT